MANGAILSRKFDGDDLVPWLRKIDECLSILYI